MGIMLVLSLIATVIKIWTGFDIDEAYALALPYRGLQGIGFCRNVGGSSDFLLHPVFVYETVFCYGAFFGLSSPFMRSVASILHIGMSVLVFSFVEKQKS